MKHGVEGKAHLLSVIAAHPAHHGHLLIGLPCYRRWLLGLLVLQSTSSFVLEQYQQLLKEHLVVTVFLTMLVGAGGNAGNQSAIKVIRGLVSRDCILSCNVSAKLLAYQHG